MSDETIRPAMTPDEWAQPVKRPERGHRRLWRMANSASVGIAMLREDGSEHASAFVDDPEACHALAALALHGQSFGFTWAHVDALRRMLDMAERWLAHGGTHRDIGPAEWQQLRDSREAVDRLAALLPPREAYHVRLDGLAARRDFAPDEIEEATGIPRPPREEEDEYQRRKRLTGEPTPDEKAHRNYLEWREEKRARGEDPDTPPREEGR